MRIIKILLLGSFFCILFMIACSKESEPTQAQNLESEVRSSYKKRIGYLWINPDIVPIIIKEIDGTSHDMYYKNLTHVIISFVNPFNTTGSSIGITDKGSKLSLTEAQLKAMIIRIKAKNPSIRVGIAIGGGEAAKSLLSRYTTILNTTTYQDKFITSVVNYVKNSGAHFIDIDLEYHCLEIRGYNSFVQKLYKSAKAKGINQTLTLEYKYGDLGIVTKVKNVTQATYASCDLLNIMSYDYNDNSSKGSQRLLDKNHSPVAIAKRDIDFFLTKVSADKIVLGLPFYGKSAYGLDPSAAYLDIDFNKLDPNGFIKGTKGSYYFNTKAMIKQKLDFVAQKNLCGVMFWSVRHDRMGDYNNSVLRYVVDNQR